MEKLTILILALAVAAVVADDTDHEVRIHSEPSGKADDAVAMAYCNHGYVIAYCECNPYSSCDGATIQVNKHGEACVAHNRAGGDGAVAVAVCRRFLLTIDSEVTNMPQATCPNDYRVIACHLHSPVSEKFESFEPKSFSKTCYTTKGCTECRVQARCIKLHQFEEIWNPHDEEEEAGHK